MTTMNNELLTLFNQVDGWFEDLKHHEPISQFILEEDRAKLALISRTTGNWFKSLIEPELSDIELEEDDDNSVLPVPKNQSKSKCVKPSQQRKTTSKSNRNSIIEHETLDSLAKNLELLLDTDVELCKDETLLIKKEAMEEMEPEFYFYNYYSEDETGLLDDSLGHCCTISHIKEEASQVDNYQSIVNNHHNYGSVNPSMQSQQNNQLSFGYTKKAHDLDVQTSLPLDHDYLAKPRPKPLVLSNKLMQYSKQNRQVKQSSVLITEAIKRFARFSDEFRILSIKTNENSKAKQ